MEQMLPNTCQITFDDPNRLHEFTLTIIPDEGYWVGGRFHFAIYIMEDYNMAVSDHRRYNCENFLLKIVFSIF